MGSHIVAALLEKGNHTITALTRKESTSVFPAGVHIKHIDYASHDSLVSALRGQDALIITMSVLAPPDQEAALVKSAAEAGVAWVMPNEWGIDCSNAALVKDISDRYGKTRELIQRLGTSSWLVVVSGFWYEYSLAGTEGRYGFDFKERRVTFYDDGKQKINTSTWVQIGKAVAALMALKILPEDENDRSEATLETFKNNFCYISSFRVSQRDMWESAMRVTGTKESDWQVKYEDVKQRYKNGVERFQKGDRHGFMIFLYARNFFPDGAGDYESSKGVHNEVLRLPKEDFDACTKAAVERAEKMAGTY